MVLAKPDRWDWSESWSSRLEGARVAHLFTTIPFAVQMQAHLSPLSSDETVPFLRLGAQHLTGRRCLQQANLNLLVTFGHCDTKLGHLTRQLQELEGVEVLLLSGVSVCECLAVLLRTWV